MTRIAPALLALSAVLLVAGMAGASTGLMIASAVVAVAMLAVLKLADSGADAVSITPEIRAEQISATSPVGEDGVVRIDAIELDGDAAAARAESKTATAVLEDEDVSDVLARVKGLGPSKVDALVDAFPSTAALRAASKDELTAVQGIGPAIADRIRAELA